MGPGRHLGHVRRRDARVVLPLLPLDRSARSGKSPSCPRSIFRVRFAVEPYLILQPCAFRDGGRHGVQDQGARERPALGALPCGPWPRRQYGMLTEERRGRRHPGAAASMQLCGCAHCQLLCQSHRALNSCAKLYARPAERAQSTGDARTCVRSYGCGPSWAHVHTDGHRPTQ